MADSLAGVFGYQGVAEAYRHRPPYPAEVFAILERAVADAVGPWSVDGCLTMQIVGSVTWGRPAGR